MERQEISLHGHVVTFRAGGSGPVLLLIHGIAGSSASWGEVLYWLAERYTIVAPDLLGHGESAKPRGDYSLGAYACGVRDLLTALGHDRATVMGHSLGGGVAMQFAYQFPERCERLVLVSSGGLGREVNLLLRLPTLPGAELLMPLLFSAPVLGVADAVAGFFGRLGLRTAPDLEEVFGSYAALGDAEARQAFVHTVRSMIDLRGQRVSAADRLYLAEGVPTMLVWGERDPLIPVRHALDAAGLIHGCRLEILPDAGHFPHRDQTRRFVRVVSDFVDHTAPAHVEEVEWRRALQRGARRQPAAPQMPAVGEG